MTDPTSADKVLVALAERASKRRGQYRKENNEEISLKENQSNKREKITEEINSQRTQVNFRPKKVEQSIKEEFPPSGELEDEEEFSDNQEEIDNDSYEFDKSYKRVDRESNIPIRKVRKIPKYSRIKNINPENASTFEEQVDLVGNLLYNKLSAFQSISALKVTQEWIDCIVDENDSLYEEVYNKLMLLNKENLLGYIRILVSALK